MVAFSIFVLVSIVNMAMYYLTTDVKSYDDGKKKCKPAVSQGL